VSCQTCESHWNWGHAEHDVVVEVTPEAVKHRMIICATYYRSCGTFCDFCDTSSILQYTHHVNTYTSLRDGQRTHHRARGGLGSRSGATLPSSRCPDVCWMARVPWSERHRSNDGDGSSRKSCCTGEASNSRHSFARQSYCEVGYCCMSLHGGLDMCQTRVEHAGP
jgi:hypothetical protein